MVIVRLPFLLPTTQVMVNSEFINKIQIFQNVLNIKRVTVSLHKIVYNFNIYIF